MGQRSRGSQVFPVPLGSALSFSQRGPSRTQDLIVISLSSYAQNTFMHFPVEYKPLSDGVCAYVPFTAEEKAELDKPRLRLVSRREFPGRRRGRRRGREWGWWIFGSGQLLVV